MCESAFAHVVVRRLRLDRAGEVALGDVLHQQHLLAQRRHHAVEGAGERADLVAALGVEHFDVEVADRDLVGHRDYLGHRLGDAAHDVEADHQHHQQGRRRDDEGVPQLPGVGVHALAHRGAQRRRQRLLQLDQRAAARADAAAGGAGRGGFRRCAGQARDRLAVLPHFRRNRFRARVELPGEAGVGLDGQRQRLAQALVGGARQRRQAAQLLGTRGGVDRRSGSASTRACARFSLSCGPSVSSVIIR
jgi:hypothetical protein